MNEQKEWSSEEEVDFLRILRFYGVKHVKDDEFDWVRFRELSSCLQNKSDNLLTKMLDCVVKMCDKEQGIELFGEDLRRAFAIQRISAKAAEKLMNRIHLMRKIHAIKTNGIDNVRVLLTLCSVQTMPVGWSNAHDEQLLIVVDKFGLENILTNLSGVPGLFDAIPPQFDEADLKRRVIEIFLTSLAGKWNGRASTEMIDGFLGVDGVFDAVEQPMSSSEADRPRRRQSPQTLTR